jgi:hypothetical protein
MRADARAVGGIRETPLEGREIVLGAYSGCARSSPLAHQMKPTPREGRALTAWRPDDIRLRQQASRKRLAIFCESILSFFALPP